LDDGPQPFDDGGIDPYQLEDNQEQVIDPETQAFVNQEEISKHKNYYDLNTQMEQNSAEIERFVQESQDGHFLQEDLSDIQNDQNGDLMSQGFDGGLPNVVSAFFGSKVSHNPSTNSSVGQTFSSRF